MYLITTSPLFLLSYRVLIKYCVFFPKILKYIPDSLGFSSVCTLHAWTTKGRRQKKWYFWVVGAVEGERGSEARPQLSAKEVPLFIFASIGVPDAEAFKTCKNTIKLAASYAHNFFHNVHIVGQEQHNSTGNKKSNHVWIV